MKRIKNFVYNCKNNKNNKNNKKKNILDEEEFV